MAVRSAWPSGVPRASWEGARTQPQHPVNPAALSCVLDSLWWTCRGAFRRGRGQAALWPVGGGPDCRSAMTGPTAAAGSSTGHLFLWPT